jgi:hypothetical protein
MSFILIKKFKKNKIKLTNKFYVYVDNKIYLMNLFYST